MRLRLVMIFIACFFTLLLSRVYYISIKSNVYYDEIAKQNAIKTLPLAPDRGQILDTKGRPLAVNKLGFSVSIKPYLYIKKQNRELLDKELQVIVDTFPDQNFTKLKKNYIKVDSYYNQDYIEIIPFIGYDDMIKHFTKLNLRENMQIKSTTQRFYPYESLASHVIGYVGKANLNDMNENEIARLTSYAGRSGIERYYNDILQGVKGEKVSKVNALNKEIEELSYKKPSSSNIVLSIDLDLQEYLAQIFEGLSGAAIVMDVKTGSVLAAGSFPEYDLNPFVVGITQEEWSKLSNDLNHPFTNKLINGLYPPGSVVKMGTALAFLNSQKINEHQKFLCDNNFELGGRKFRCWKPTGHGYIDMNGAIRESCDVYFYKGALEVGIDFISATFERMGFGTKTGIDLPNEFIGTVPSKLWKQQKYNQPWYQGETLNTSIGQGDFLATPMQVAKFTAMIATSKSVTPHFLKSIDDNTTKIIFDNNESVFSTFELAKLPLLRRSMYEVANEEGGTTSRYLKKSPVTIAAKTGTAQVVGISQSEKKRIKEEELEYFFRSHAWITSYAPYEKPQYVVVVLIEHGKSGSSTGGPMLLKIYQKLIELGYIDKKYVKST
ncbi:penicillin-binding protein 2 [Campylobacter insulaenigrae]|uniref:Penicillin-binding protein 2 n=1 Tax=Campylobacter insulaenigrae TaxID=260714 RepID=A0ABY3G2L9_9BACT|nr:penicillin-binding protein 2 [Campylobacter insulaenigrae]MCR6570197.1 penicillin-binding protein 2 [Campylobacter insulaenigrae]MCR6571982.1 penicillin-binding protein 2 [Campylobacter insulaenigrae]MCR6576291.1 penicillin-binding protein 2 [Campylobacter insulaenigrae]MCR6581330.1 penicillin-binding protein 2 [Campylobacter insulaenigrae]MCR6590592.1 penicillin-binding protein 2 [Campylobacter insulaenigrae]